MSTGNIDPNKPAVDPVKPSVDPVKPNVDTAKSLRVQVELLKEKVKHLEEKNQDQQKYIDKSEKEKVELVVELKQTRQERDSLKLKYEVLKGEMKHAQNSLVQSEKRALERGKAARLRNFIASIFFLQSSVLTGLGINMVTSTPPNSSGWALVSIAAGSYILAALLTTLFTEGGN